MATSAQGRCELFCDSQNDGHFAMHSLKVEGGCLVIKDLGGHIHGPDCGHEMAPHGDHLDYLVGEELHHVLPWDAPCCAYNCVGVLPAKAVVSHGRVSVVRNRKRKSVLTSGAASKEPAGDVQVIVEDEASEDRGATVKIYATGICCPSEVPLITRLLTPLPGVIKVDVAVITKTISVVYAPNKISPDKLVAALNEACLDASLTQPREHTGLKGGRWPSWHVLLATVLLCISLFHYVEKPTGQHWWGYLKYIALAAIALGLPSICLKAFGSLRNWVLDINTLMVLAVCGAVAIGDYSEGAAVVVLFSFAGYLEDRCSRRARDAIAAVLALKPEKAQLASNGMQVLVGEIAIGTLVVVKPGDQVPIDGRVVTGSSRVDQSMMTGESVPLKKIAGDEVMGGTLNCGGGHLEIETTTLAGDSTVAQMANLVEQASMQKSPMESMVTRFAKWYTPIVVLAALCIVVIPIGLGVPDKRAWVYLGLQILVTACPCALVISTPVTMVTGLARAAQQGVLIKGGQYLEALAKCKVATFDKTGTLTQGRFKVVQVYTYNGVAEVDMLQLAGCVEQVSSHPLAIAIVGRAAASHVSLNLCVNSTQTVSGCGILADVSGHAVAVGNRKLLASYGVKLDNDAQVQDMESLWAGRGASLCWVACDGTLYGALVVADSVRPEGFAAVQGLKGMGLHCAMLTGDSIGTANHIASALGIQGDDVHAALLPEDKLEKVNQYRIQHGKVMHIGDGVNDAPALAAADVGIAMGAAGAAVAVEAADIALFTNDLRCLGPIVKLGQLARRKIFQNISLSVITKVVVLVLAALGKFSLWGAVLVDVGQLEDVIIDAAYFAINKRILMGGASIA
ncbi:g473 [Coccomyxa elongata]